MKVPQKWITIGKRGFSADNIDQLLCRNAAGIRINTAHSSFPWICEMIGRLSVLGYPMENVLLDIANSKTRIKTPGGLDYELKADQTIMISNEDQDDPAVFHVNNKYFFGAAKKGDGIYFGDGELECVVQEADDVGLTLLVKTNGIISNNKSVGIKGKDISEFTISEDEIVKINCLLERYPVSLILSFIHTAQEIQWARMVFRNASQIIPKIETQQAVIHIGEILEECGTVFVGRGDLALSVGIEKIGIVQKYLVDEAHKRNCKVAVGTGTLDSLRNAEIPLRAEIIDITNSCLSGVDYIALTSETGGSSNPYKVIDFLDKTLSFMEML